MHTGHHTDVVIVDLIDLLQIEEQWQLALLVCEDKVCNRLRDEGRADEGLRVCWGLLF